MSEKVTALILAAGSGSRMGDGVKKQYRLLLGEPLIVHTLRAFARMAAVDDILLAVPQGEEDDCRNLVAGLEFSGLKRIRIVTGGERRCDSVLNGLREAQGDIVLIHDGARPFADEKMINAIISDVKSYGSGVAAVPVKDTIRVCDADGFGVTTPDRSTLMSMQTPQAFRLEEIRRAYEAVLADESVALTDDAQVYMLYTGKPVKLTYGSYENIKITTPEDMLLAQEIARLRGLER